MYFSHLGCLVFNCNNCNNCNASEKIISFIYC